MSVADRGVQWRSHNLIVRKSKARGGPSGLRYEVRLDSLPTELQAKFLEAAVSGPAVTESTKHGPSNQRKTTHLPPNWADWRLDAIRPALGHPAGSRERGAAIEEIAKQRHRTPDGQLKQLSVRTIRTWLRDYEARGIGGLRRATRNDQGRERTLISRRWDNGVPFSIKMKQDIEQKLVRYVRSLWASGVSGESHAARFATTELISLTQKAAHDLAEGELLRLCHVPRRFVRRHRGHQLIATKDKDAKLFFDKHLPRGRRNRTSLKPMQVVVGDVHHLDVMVGRPDGSAVYPKAIAWHDAATNRLRVDVVFPPKGKGIRAEHVIDSFIGMALDPNWGVPGMLYLDNGGEYNWASFIDDAMKLSLWAQECELQIRHLADDPEMSGSVQGMRRSVIIKSRPYNAPAKTIEGLFGVLERGVLPHLPGHIGGDRTAKKTANVGQPPKPYSAGFEAFQRDVNTALDYYHTITQSGHLNGRSPREAFSEALNDGWRSVGIDRHALEAVFAREVSRKVVKGEIKVAGKHYSHSELLTRTGETVSVRIPIAGDRERLAVLEPSGLLICFAELEMPYDFLDPAGARRQSQRARDLNSQIAEMRRDTDKLDLTEEMRRTTQLHPPEPTAERAGFVRLSDRIEAIGEARRQAGEQPATDDVAKLVDEQRRHFALISKLR